MIDYQKVSMKGFFMHNPALISNRLFKIKTFYQRLLACSLIFLVGLPIGVEAQDEDVPLDMVLPVTKDVYSESDQVNWYDGERYDILSGKLNHYIEDIKIEGDGMPIVVARQHLAGSTAGQSGIGGIDLAIPKIEFFSFGGGDWWRGPTYGTATSYGPNRFMQAAQRTCTGLRLAYGYGDANTQAINIQDIKNLRSNIKFDDGQRTVRFFPRNENPGDVSRFPSDAEYVSPDNWYITCNGTSFNVHTNDGITYQMTNWYSMQSEEYGAARHRIYLSKVTDVHGNWIQYNYTDPGRPNVGGLYRRGSHSRFVFPTLNSIKASDGREVTIKYEAQGSNWIVTINDNGTPNQRSVRYVRDIGRLNNNFLYTTVGDRLTVTFEDASSKVYTWERFRFNNGRKWVGSALSSIKLRGGGVIKYQHAAIPYRSYIDRWSDRYETHRLLRRTLHTSSDLPAVVEHEFGWEDVDSETFSRTISNSSNTVEYRLKKTYPDTVIQYQIKYRDLPYTRIKDSGRLIEFKNHGRRISDAQWNADLIPEVRKNYNWVELSKVVDFDNVLARFPKHVGFASYYESIVLAAKEITTRLTRSDGGYNTFKTTHESFDDYGLPTSTKEISNDLRIRPIETTYYNRTAPWINGLVKTTTFPGHSVRNQYNPNGTLFSSTINGIHTDYTYSNEGNLETVTNADRHVHRYDDYHRGISKKETDANGHVTIREVNNDGTLKSETIKGYTVKTQYEYDERRRVNKITSPEGRVIDLTHKADVSVTYNNGLINVVRRDGLGREFFNGNFGNMGNADNVSLDWSSVVTRYDADGRVSFVSHPWSIKDSDAFYSIDDFKIGLSYKYDGLGRVIRIRNYANDDAFSVGGMTYEHNKKGFEVHAIDDIGNRTVNSYRAYGSPSNRMLVKSVDPSGQITSISRDFDGVVLAVTRNNLLRSFYHNSRRQLEQETHPENGTTDYTYWPDGQLKTRKNKGVTTVYEYDKHNRLTKESLSESNGSTLVRDYDYRDDDLLKWISNTSSGYSPSQSTQTAYSYDWDGNLTSETLAVDDQQMNMAFTYDARGSLSTVRYPTVRRYDLHPNSHGWPTKLIDDAGKTVYNTIEHHPNGMLHNLERPNYRYSQELWWLRMPAELKSVGSGLKNARQLYRYYENLNVSSIEGSTVTEKLTLEYDKSSRLQVANSGLWGTRIFKYDENDNIDWTNENGQVTDYEYDPSTNHLTRMKTGVVDRWFGYDPRGNMFDNGKHSLTFNAADQVLTSSDGASYVYDGQGRRVKTVRDGNTVYQMYDQSGKLRYRSEPASNLQSEYLYVNDKLFARRDSDDGQGDEYGEIFRDDFEGSSVSSNFSVPPWAIPNRAAVNNLNSCSQSDGYLSLAIKNVGNESQACYLISNIGDIGPGDDSTIKVDYRANVSGVKAPGAWFAGWLYPKGLNPDGSNPAEDNDPTTGTEFDVFEYMPTWDTAYNTAIHDGAAEQQWIYGDLLNGIDLRADEFHTYSMEWNKDCVVFSIDDIPVRASTSPLISSAKKHAIYLTMEAQSGVQWNFWDVGDFKQNLDANPSVGKIDWVSVSRKAGIDPNLCDGAPPSDPPTDPPPGDATPWGPPQNLSASTDSDSQISLSWSPVETAIKYNVYRDDQYIDTVTGQTNYADSGLTAGTTYSYYVTAIRDTATDEFSGKSTSASATTTGGTNPPPGDTTPWGAPQNLSASAQSDSQISLSWNPVETAIKYNVYRNDQYIDTVTGATTYTDSGLAAGTTYSYYATAIRDTATDQFSGKSTSASATTTGGTNPPPNDPPPSGTTPWGAPQNLSASSQSDSQISLGWSPVDTAIKYNVYRNDQYIDTVTGATTYIDSGLAAGTTYSYYATAIRDTTTDQFSGKSASASATTSGSTPPNSGQNPTPPVLSGQDYSSSAIEITWTASSDSDGAVVEYEVVRTANGQSITHVTNGRSWWQADLSADTEYTYSVKAVDNDGNRSASSNVITVRTRK